MKKVKHIHNEIVKLRKLTGLRTITEEQRASAWCSMITLQWVLSRKAGVVTPTNVCAPQLFRYKPAKKGRENE